MSEGYTEVTPQSHSTESCAPIREVLNCIGDKWSTLIISLLEAQPLRFNELRRQVPSISQRMQARTLRDLERNGLVFRKVESTLPLSVYYGLTPLGKTLLKPVKILISWARQNHPKMDRAQKNYDLQQASII